MINTIKNTSENRNMPITIFLNKVKNLSTTVQKNIEFIFILTGELEVTINNQKYKLEESDVVLINNGDVYEIHGKGENLVLSMQIDNDFFTEVVKKEQNIFLCNSCIDGKENKHYDHIRKLLAKAMSEYSYRENGYEFKLMSLLYELIYLLNNNFVILEDYNILNLEIKSSKYTERINNIVAYIKKNYYQQISLQDVADSQYLTPEYLSKFFKVQMGMTFSKYLNEFRLSKAVKELIRTDNSVTKIAMNNGFPNLVAFNKIFKEIYDTTPAEYRNQVRKKQSNNFQNELTNEGMQIEVTSVDYNQALDKLTRYVEKDEVSTDKKQNNDLSNSVIITANVEATKAIKHTWKNLINLGYAQDGLRSDLQQQLSEIQNKIRFKYARFQGIFSDEMLSFGEEKADKSNYNFSKIDKVIDFLHSINLKPFIELGGKAKVLNRTFDKVMYFRNSSENQKNLKESLVLLEKFIRHSINRYGINEVEQWYFEFWKEGEIDYVFWNGSFDKYLSTFQSYYKIIKELIPKAKIGGPGFNPEINMKLFGTFLEQVKKTNTKLDFLSLSLYPYELIEDTKVEKLMKKNNLESKINNSGKGEYMSPLLPSKDRDYSKVKLDKIRKVIKESGVDIKEIHVTEYNSGISHRHPANDTTYKAAFITKNIIDNLDEINSFGYWFCSDVSGELEDSKSLLYGDMGLVSASGIKKPGFFAYEMLAKLGTELVQKGDGYIVTKKSSYNYEIITYNYKHFDYLYCLKGENPVNLDQYYSIFENQQELNLHINLKGIKAGRYRIKKYILNRIHGSIFDEWLNMNAINNIKKDEIDYLKQICVPKQTVFYLEGTDELKLESCLSPHEVNFYEVTFEYS